MTTSGGWQRGMASVDTEILDIMQSKLKQA
jgi:hypothetical protein